MWYNRNFPYSLLLTPMHMSLFSGRLIIFQAYQFREKDTLKLLNKRIMIRSYKARPCIHD